MRVLILGNSGSGKTTMARELAERHGLEHLDLDSVVWEPHRVAVARPRAAVCADLDAFADRHPRWVVEGAYGELIAHLAARAAPDEVELRLLDPGVEHCLANHERRPWEPEKYDRPEQQDANRAMLADWIRGYDQRDDETGRAFHQRLFESFEGPRRRYGAAELGASGGGD